jgi:hypothetical protein
MLDGLHNIPFDFSFKDKKTLKNENSLSHEKTLTRHSVWNVGLGLPKGQIRFMATA